MNRKKKKSGWFEWLEALFLAVIIVTFIRVFFFDIFAVTSSSMEKSLLTGDFIFVSKVSYGPRLPMTPLSIPLTHQAIPFTSGTKSYSTLIRFPYFRLPGFSDIKLNDVIVFNYPLDLEHPPDHRTYYIKRCVALPGDTLTILRKQIYVNNSLLEDQKDTEYNYHVKTDSMDLGYDWLHEFGITEGGKVSNQGDWQLTMRAADASKIIDFDFVEDVIELAEQPGKFSDYIFPHNEKFPWNIDNYGPVVIPKKGDSVLLSLENIALYKRLITGFEKNAVEISDSAIIVNGLRASHYLFKMNYYFMVGDNRHNSVDSRYWGFVPEDHIVGKATFVLFSSDRNEKGFFNRIRWERIMSGVN